MGFLKEFKEFAVKGNVMDMAVGVIIGGAFGKIVTSVVNDIIMPPIGLQVGGVDFSDLKLTMKKAVLDAAGEVVSPAVTWNYGAFIQQVV
ncbi:MAG: large conductance mechanosensitive channel protein MscL, partial [Alistipes sp.]|nr:large conductance mechanosensitive channel protein MscL [Alistipes sp.]